MSKRKGICTIRQREGDDSGEKRLYYIRGILRNRLSYCNQGLAIKILREVVEAGASLDSLESHAKSVRNWSEWRTDLEDFMEDQDNGH